MRNVFLFSIALLNFSVFATLEVRTAVELLHTHGLYNHAQGLSNNDLIVLKWSDGKLSACTLETIRISGSIQNLHTGNQVAFYNGCGICGFPASLVYDNTVRAMQGLFAQNNGGNSNIGVFLQNVDGYDVNIGVREIADKLAVLGVDVGISEEAEIVDIMLDQLHIPHWHD
ncbi:MAG: hypothetical protein LBB21_02670 [Holosporaceae bacterium]|jgi:hypothetical protein|nr:hypothetical protein [Holosporaceae bacterium]